MTDKKTKLFLSIAIVLVLAVAAAFIIFGKKDDATTVAASDMPGAIGAPGASPAAPVETAAEIKTADALEQRALGDEDAPVKIEEYASLTCSHCAHFYNDVFPKLKSNYIDKGKVYFVFSDFPLNAPAMHASMIARCVPEKDYFEFVENLFAEQDKWGFDPNYLTFLKEKAAKHGVNGATFQSCLQNSEIQQGIVKRMEAAQAQWQISSTPTFVVNNKKTINGAVAYEEFAKAIEEAMGNPVTNIAPEPKPETATTPAPAATETTEPAKTETAPATTAPASSTATPAAAKTETPATTTPKAAEPVKTTTTTTPAPATTTVPNTTETPAATTTTPAKQESATP